MKLSGKNLIVGGCSASDYTGVEHVYGDYIAKVFRFNYIHEARGIGSNYRIWRTISNKIIKKEITSEDIILIQYTSVDRQEFFSPYSKKEHPMQNSKTPLNDLYYSGSIIRYKQGSYTWQPNPEESEFFELFQKFNSKKFNIENFFYHHYSFQTLCLHFGIKHLYFLESPYYDSRHLLDAFKKNVINIKDLFKNFPLKKDDPFHLSQAGHRAVADKICNVLRRDLR